MHSLEPGEAAVRIAAGKNGLHQFLIRHFPLRRYPEGLGQTPDVQCLGKRKHILSKRLNA